MRHKTAGKFIRRRADFSVEAPVGSQVFLAGTFNNWSETAKPMVDRKSDGVYTCRCFLVAGKYEYKFIVNGVWQLDKSNPKYVANDFGSLNSVLVLGDGEQTESMD